MCTNTQYTLTMRKEEKHIRNIRNILLEAQHSISRDHTLSPLLRASARLNSIAIFKSLSISWTSSASTRDSSLCRAISADKSDTLDERERAMTGVTTRERGDEGEMDFKGVLHADRGRSRLPDVPRLELELEDKLELRDGK